MCIKISTVPLLPHHSHNRVHKSQRTKLHPFHLTMTTRKRHLKRAPESHDCQFHESTETSLANGNTLWDTRNPLSHGNLPSESFTQVIDTQIDEQQESRTHIHSEFHRSHIKMGCSRKEPHLSLSLNEINSRATYRSYRPPSIDTAAPMLSDFSSDPPIAPRNAQRGEFSLIKDSPKLVVDHGGSLNTLCSQ